MSLINRQNQNIGLTTIIETPTSIFINGQEHDASTLTPLFGKIFYPLYSNTLNNGVIFTKYCGWLGSTVDNTNHTLRTQDFAAFSLDDIDRGMKDMIGYRWTDGFNYYVMEYGGYRMWKFNPGNQNLTYALTNKPDATAVDSYRRHENWIIDEDSSNFYMLGCGQRSTVNSYRLGGQFAVGNKNTNVGTNSDGITNNTNCYHAYIGRSSSRIFAFRSIDNQKRTQFLTYFKSLASSSISIDFTHSGSHVPIPSETFELDNSGSLGFYYTHTVPNGIPSGSASGPKYSINRIIFNKDGNQASGSISASISAYQTTCSIDFTASGSSTPNDLWPMTWTTSDSYQFQRRTKLFLNSPSSSVKYLIAFNMSPYNYDETNKSFYTSLVFEVSSSNTAALTYRSSRLIYNDIGGETRSVMGMNDDNTRFLAVGTYNAAVYTFNTSSKALSLAQIIPGEWRHFGTDTYGRLWLTNYNHDLYCFTLDSPVKINVTATTSSYNYTGTSLSSSVDVEARNYLGSYISVSTRLTIEGNSAVFTSNGLGILDVTTSSSGSLNVPITINNGGFTRVIASSNF